MRHLKLLFMVALAVASTWIGAPEVIAKGFKGGSQGRGGGGGASRGGARHASMPNLGSSGRSRPQPSISRPSSSRPSISRPSTSRPSTSRPSFNRPTTSRPNISRPGGPQLDRPNLGGSISGGLKPATRPSTRPNFPSTLPGTKPSLPSARPGNRPERPATLPGNTLPGNRPNRPSTLPGKKPSLPGNKPNRPSFPSLDNGGRPGRLPGHADRPSAGDVGDFLGIGGGVHPTTLPGKLPNRPDIANRPDRPGNNRPGIDRPGNNRPGNDRPGNNRPGNDRPGNDRPGNNRPGNDRPGNNRPGNDRPGIDRPGNNRPGNDRPGNNRPNNRPNSRPNNRPINIGSLNVGNQVINNRPTWSNIDRTSVNRIQNRWGNQIGGLHGWAGARPGRINQWHSWGNDVRFRWNGYHHHNNWFAGDWWYSHPGGLCPWHYYHSFNRYPWNYWWRRPTWTAASSWFTWSAPATVWSQPIYYDYGSGGNVTYENNNVYINGEEVATADEFAQSAAALATVTPPVSPATEGGEIAAEDVAGQEVADSDAADSDQWMPLGTFALSTDEDDVEPTRLVQLAVDKSGIISGTLYNRETDQADAIQGRVDKQTQRVAMRLGSTDEIVAETGLYNLTQDEAPLLVHFGTDRVENYVLVRLEEPEEPADSADAEADTVGDDSAALDDAGSADTGI
ncbi:mu-protocadherin- cell-suface protein [Allorhodopirellula solitaria]|uniref:Mu-protocadherin-putative cell-suface protein n=1 Tax=Allorhodopirellula solitaria TaxID=2527987 RepID=A0A5C5YEE1_9BACT|nr:mu-protocadherin- cell-suface protein [Allorhodopirellula solitaria]TWT74116.1 hypothetical protein CA85_10020 [Allorhodopirellula solitaria]